MQTGTSKKKESRGLLEFRGSRQRERPELEPGAEEALATFCFSFAKDLLGSPEPMVKVKLQRTTLHSFAGLLRFVLQG